MTINSVTVIIRQNNRTDYYVDIFWAEILGPMLVSRRRWQRLPLHLVRSPAHSGSALNCGRENISKTHSILHFHPTDTPEKRLVVSASYIFHGRQPQAQKSKAQCHHPGIQEIPESLSFITKIICEHKQMWSTNMPFNWGGRWSHRRQDGQRVGTVEKKACVVVTTTLDLCHFNWETGSGAETHKT